MVDYLVRVLEASWGVLGEMSPYLLLGFLMAGVLSVFISADWVKRNLGGRGVGPVVKASLFGVPLPLCSCGVIPVSASIRRSGASKASTASFLLSTPQTGVDSILVTWSLLGPVFAIFRPIAALLTGVLGGWLVQLLDQEKPDDSVEIKPAQKDGGDEGCCTAKGISGSKIKQVFIYGFVTLPRDIGLSLPVGILIAGLITAVIPQDALQDYIGRGWGSILLMMVVGIPIYVCATASVPIAAGFMYLGAAPGAALAFLIAGPVTNMATLMTIWKLLGRRTMFIYLFTVGVSAVGGGLMLNQIILWVESAIPQLSSGGHEHAAGGWWQHLSAIVLLGVMGWSYFGIYLPRGRRTGALVEVDRQNKADEQTAEFVVKGMTCSHCVAHVKEVIGDCEGVAGVEVSLKGGEVVVKGRDIIRDRIIEAVTKLGYTIRPVTK